MITLITRDELLQLLNAGEKFKLVNVQSRKSFEMEHIKGSISLPLDEIEKRAKQAFKKNEKIVVYCAGFGCKASAEAAEKLSFLGYKDVVDYKGGLTDYKESGEQLMGRLHEKTNCIGYGCCGFSVAPKFLS